MADCKPLNPTSRTEVVDAIQHGMLSDGRRPARHWDGINARVAAEMVADYLYRSNFVVLRGPPPNPVGDTLPEPGDRL